MAARHTASSASWRSVNPSVSSGWRSTGASRTWRESSWPSATTAASPATRAISHVPRACASTAVRISLPMTVAVSTFIWLPSGSESSEARRSAIVVPGSRSTDMIVWPEPDVRLQERRREDGGAGIVLEAGGGLEDADQHGRRSRGRSEA